MKNRRTQTQRYNDVMSHGFHIGILDYKYTAMVVNLGLMSVTSI
jgi:hypothetical protein